MLHEKLFHVNKKKVDVTQKSISCRQKQEDAVSKKYFVHKKVVIFSGTARHTNFDFLGLKSLSPGQFLVRLVFSQFFYFRGNIGNVKEKDFDLSSGPRLFQSSFWGVPTHADVIEFSNFLLRIKTQKRLVAKLCVAYYYFSFERNYDVLKSKGPRLLLKKI